MFFIGVGFAFNAPITLSANLLIALAYALMALARQTEAVFVAAALAGVGWTLTVRLHILDNLSYRDTTTDASAGAARGA